MLALVYDASSVLVADMTAMVEAMIAAFYTNQKCVVRVSRLLRDSRDGSIIAMFTNFPEHPGMRISFGSGASQHDARMKMELLAPLNIFIRKDGTAGLACPFVHAGDAHEIVDKRECGVCETSGCARCLHAPNAEYDEWHCPTCRYEDIPNSQR